MDSPQVTNAGLTSPLAGLALVVFLVAGAIVDSTTPRDAGSELYAPSVASPGSPAAAARKMADGARLPMPALFISDARAHAGPEAEATSAATRAATGDYFPDRFINQATTYAGNVMTYEHD